MCVIDFVYDMGAQVARLSSFFRLSFVFLSSFFRTCLIHMCLIHVCVIHVCVRGVAVCCCVLLCVYVSHSHVSHSHVSHSCVSFMFVSRVGESVVATWWHVAGRERERERGRERESVNQSCLRDDTLSPLSLSQARERERRSLLSHTAQEDVSLVTHQSLVSLSPQPVLSHGSWWVLYHCTGFARLVWGRLRVHRLSRHTHTRVLCVRREDLSCVTQRGEREREREREDVSCVTRLILVRDMICPHEQAVGESLCCSVLQCADSYVRHDSSTWAGCWWITRTCVMAWLMCDMTHLHVWRDSFTWLVHMCDMTHLHEQPVGESVGAVWWHDSCGTCHTRCLVCDMTHSHVWHDSFMCVTWLIHMCDMTHLHDTFTCVTWLIHVCDMTHSHVWHVTHDDLYVTWLIQSHGWHDSFMCVTWLIHMCDMTHLHEQAVGEAVRAAWWHDSYGTWLIYICDMTHSHVWDDLFICVPWLISMSRLLVNQSELRDDMTPVWHDSFTCVTWLMCGTWLVYMSRLFVNQSGLRRCEFADGCVIDVGFTQDKYNNALWGKVRVRVCDMTRSCVWHDAFICVTWRIHTCDMSHSYVWHDAFTCVTWHTHMCDMTH